MAPPPSEYDYEPDFDYRVITVNQVRLKRMVHGVPDSHYVFGYARQFSNPPTIYVWECLSLKGRKDVLRHEIGHLNGWRHNTYNY